MEPYWHTDLWLTMWVNIWQNTDFRERVLRGFQEPHCQVLLASNQSLPYTGSWKKGVDKAWSWKKWSTQTSSSQVNREIKLPRIKVGSQYLMLTHLPVTNAVCSSPQATDLALSPRTQNLFGKLSPNRDFPNVKIAPDSAIIKFYIQGMFSL